MKKYILPAILFVITAALTVVSVLLLPETVVTQFGGDRVTVMPKLLAVLLPAALGLGGAGAGAFTNGQNRKKSMLVSVVGVVVFVIMLVVNL